MNMAEGMTCYERDETFCQDGMCLRTGCRLRNKRLDAERLAAANEPSEVTVRRMRDEEWRN